MSPKKPSSISSCLDHLQIEWRKNKSIASLWQDWPKIAGEQLSEHCFPLTFFRGILTIGVNHPQWIQALMFSRNKLLATLRAAGHDVKDLRIRQHYPNQKQLKDSEPTIWAKHPSRSDIHGKTDCPICHNPTPSGEISLWKKCSFCWRKDLSK
ncbi:DUF721 domain-containing protein [Prochlorococcus marinus]|uniref:DUF721 domain-containing protein n=1 Tax=Prochlorococcus marinus TaxID=1219 RepID=UPI0022B2CA57|nr:DUF721 domain-containing protein [Prochlorococcus marinus]